MKAFFIVFFIFNITQSQAKCSSEGFYIFPKNKALNQNSCLLMEGYGRNLQFVESLTKEYPVYLESEDKQKIKLNIVQFNEGAFRVNQVLLKPEEYLTAATKYTLKIGNLDESESVPYALRVEQKPIYWHTNSNTNNQPAKLLTTPKLINKSTVRYGCGPSKTATFEFITDSNSTVLVKTELMDLTDGTSRTYFLKTNKEGTLTIGHGMCSGAFDFKQNHLYQARFSTMDDCNFYQDEWSDWIEFDSPYNTQSKSTIERL